MEQTHKSKNSSRKKQKPNYLSIIFAESVK